MQSEDALAIRAIPLVQGDVKDQWVWRENNNGVYSVKSQYQDSSVPPKIRFFSWRLCPDSLPTKSNLLKKVKDVSEEHRASKNIPRPDIDKQLRSSGVPNWSDNTTGKHTLSNAPVLSSSAMPSTSKRNISKQEAPTDSENLGNKTGASSSWVPSLLRISSTKNPKEKFRCAKLGKLGLI
ncbi:hypothetical protein ACFE04_008144 [Oxalis oulophora]